MKLIIIFMLLLIHRESGDTDRIEACDQIGPSLMVDFIFSNELIPYPASEYECVLVVRVGG